MGWCVGCNPPFVDCGIRLIGLPAPSGRFFIGAVCPFHLQDGRFTVSRPADSASKGVIAMSSWTFRFCSVAKALAFPPRESAILRVGGVSSDPSHFYLGPESHTPTRQPKVKNAFEANKVNPKRRPETIKKSSRRKLDGTNNYSPVSIGIHEQACNPHHRHSISGKNRPRR